ncbi:MAG: flagellar hook-basal body complex protein FliE [Alkalispirochaeta sp.]
MTNLFDPGQVQGTAMQIARTNPSHLPGRNEPLPTSSTETGFRDRLIGSLGDVNDAQINHEQLSVQAVVDPDSVEAHDLTIAAAEANMTLGITRNVVDRVIQAYRDITNLR